MKNSLTIIAHRGYSGKFPENTLLAYQAAYAHGARWMECDIQLTHDLVPIVHHDENLLRMTGADKDIRMVTAKSLRKLSGYYPEKFGETYIGNPLCTLKDLCKWIRNHKDIKMFIEIKKHSLETFGIQKTMEAVFQVIKKVKKQCIIISFDPYIIDHANQKFKLSNGWVIPEWNDVVAEKAKNIQPDFLFSNKNIMPENPDDWWQAEDGKPWHWANYNVDHVEDLPQWQDKGLKFIETNEIADILKAQNKMRFTHD